MYDENAMLVMNYDPNNLMNALMDMLRLKNDAALAHALGVGQPAISNMRHKRIPIGAAMLIKMHEVSNMSIKDLRILMGDRRPHFRSHAALQEQSVSSY